MRLQEYGAHGLSYTCIHLHVLVASIRQPWKLKRVQENRRVGALEYSRSCTSKKCYNLGFLRLLYLGQLHCPFHTWADNPLPYKVQNRLFGSFTWVKINQKNSTPLSIASLLPPPSSPHCPLFFSSLHGRKTPLDLNVVAPKATGLVFAFL